MLAHRNCSKCAGKTVVWKFGDEIFRVTARKDQFNKVEDFICNECRYDHKNIQDWTIEGPAKITKESVISQNQYQNLKKGSIIHPIENKVEPQE